MIITVGECLYTYLPRVLDIEKAGIGKSPSGEIHAETHDTSADSHALLWPLEVKGQITRRLSGWCTVVPAVSVACKMESIQVHTLYPHMLHGVQLVTVCVCVCVYRCSSVLLTTGN